MRVLKWFGWADDADKPVATAWGVEYDLSFLGRAYALEKTWLMKNNGAKSMMGRQGIAEPKISSLLDLNPVSTYTVDEHLMVSAWNEPIWAKGHP